ncbi:MAG: amidase [Chthoniobacterales bacterium]
MARLLNQLFHYPTHWLTIAGTVLIALVVTTWLTGCAIPRPPAAVTPDRAFVSYWPAPPDNKNLRLAVKDLIDMKGIVTSAGSEYVAKNSPPAKRDAKCLEIARERGVHIVGKTNTSELALAVSGINDYFGTPRNPLSRWPLIPGGSSCGNAVALANNEADVAFGTDSAGSIRFPAACCGIVGLKTTFGLVPIDGVFPIAPNQLDTVGPMARDVAGVVQGMDLLQAGFADKYRQAVAAKPSAKAMKVGRLYIKGTAPSVDGAVDNALTAAGFEVVKMSPEFTDQWAQAQRDAATVAAVCSWIYDQKFVDKIGVTVRTKAVMALGGIEYNTTYRPALRRRAAWKAAIASEFQKVNFIALPTMKKLPPLKTPLAGSFAFEARTLALMNTQSVNFAGVPALAIPVPIRNKSIPVTSLQLIGPNRSEAELLNAGRLIEEAVKVR